MAKAVVIYGPPGSGKGTQANLLAWTKGFIHFDTGKFLEQLVHDPDNQADPEITNARRQLDSGELVTPEFVLKITAEATLKISKSNFGIVFSGSPRTIFEAFGDGKQEGLATLLEREYGKDNVIYIHLVIDPQKAILRNKNRRVCEVCKTAILYSDDTHAHKTCPLCGGKLVIRTVDNPKVLQTRIKEYEERTAPILAELKRRGYKINDIDGLPAPYDVFKDLKKVLRI